MAIPFLKWSGQTIQQRLLRAMLISLILLSTNVAAHVWGNRQREKTQEALHEVLARQEDLFFIADGIRRLQQEATLMAQIEVQSPLNPNEVSAMDREIEGIRKRILALQSPGFIETAPLLQAYEQIAASWQRYFAAYGIRHETAILELSIRVVPLHQQLTQTLLPTLKKEIAEEIRRMEQAIYDMPRNIFAISIVIFLSSFGGTLFIVHITSRYIVGRLSILIAGTQTIRLGNLEHQIPEPIKGPIDGADEFDHLTDAFNMMTRHLARSQRKLVEANYCLEEFNQSVAHDLRSPLRHIGGFAESMSIDFGDRLGDDGRHRLDRIIANTRHMDQIINAFLSLARISYQILHIQTVPLGRIVDEITGELIIEHPDRQIDFVIDKEAVSEGDTELLKIVVSNLIQNAVKFTANLPSAKIEFGAFNGTFFVRDNGIGFAMETADRLFKPFQRLQSSHGFEGTGVGLAIVKRIIDLHEGTIWAESAPEKGATFYFRLKRDRPADRRPLRA